MSHPALALAEVGPQRPGVAELSLFELLAQQAQAEEISQTELVRRLGIDHGLWSRARRGLERFGVASCARLVERYPHMKDAAARYLADSRRSAQQAKTALHLVGQAEQLARDDAERPLVDPDDR